MNIDALKTLGGALYYTLTRYNEKELSGRDYELFCSHLHVSMNTVYCLDVLQDGFLFTAKDFRLRYFHHEYHSERVIEFEYL